MFGVVELDEDFLLLDVFFRDQVAFGDDADDLGGDLDLGFDRVIAQGADFAALEDVDLEVALLDLEGGHFERVGLAARENQAAAAEQEH
jgi:hypothetical protein